jgi:hypothetical protein
MALVEGKHIALWLPDGTVFGPSSLTGKPSTTNALERIATKLESAAVGQIEQ